MAVRANATESQLKDDARRIAANSRTTTWSTYDRLFVDLGGRLWMQDWRHSTVELVPDGWTAFDPDGKLIGRLIIPAPKIREERQGVVSFGRDEVIIRRNDSDGAIHYLAYPIVQKK
ncbi:MAG: hypothetical protein ACO1Q7_19865 [Gemmatimonas sp.]